MPQDEEIRAYERALQRSGKDVRVVERSDWDDLLKRLERVEFNSSHSLISIYGPSVCSRCCDENRHRLHQRPRTCSCCKKEFYPSGHNTPEDSPARETCSQCGVEVMGAHSCQGVPG